MAVITVPDSPRSSHRPARYSYVIRRDTRFRADGMDGSLVLPTPTIIVRQAIEARTRCRPLPAASPAASLLAASRCLTRHPRSKRPRRSRVWQKQARCALIRHRAVFPSPSDAGRYRQHSRARSFNYCTYGIVGDSNESATLSFAKLDHRASKLPIRAFHCSQAHIGAEYPRPW